MDAFVSALVVFLVVIDPPGLVPIFIALTQGFDARRKRLIALRGTALSLAVIVFFAYFGEMVLDALSIGMAAFRISGGALLFWIAFEMLFERRADRKESTADEARSEEEAHDLSVFPLAVPLIAGPGAITSTLLLMDRYGTGIAGQMSVLFAAGTVIAGLAVILMLADTVRRLLGRTIINTVTRVLGIVLAALAAQTVISGITAIYPPG
ncbi:multiple antibiotic resistance protein [Azospirillum fermentarium]|uniref:MarC family protein n=1 Tax=Azospirillum fermentarium TaxID=1233114 RepID=UPI002225DC7B|nr:MarC family protein [Azospirillum fermentarium]MCW2244708.1 multiple antibiotic resistance protein [Azospirillum fermentarium]